MGRQAQVDAVVLSEILRTRGQTADLQASRNVVDLNTRQRRASIGLVQALVMGVDSCWLQGASNIARGGQMIDASIVQAPKQSLNKEEKAIVVDDNAMPADWSPAKRRQKDVDARWTKKHGKAYFGYLN